MNGRLFSCLILLQLLQMISAVMDTIAANQYIRDGETVISAGEMFELGFFSPGISKNRYLGIWNETREGLGLWQRDTGDFMEESG
ncbi:hypothetical protein L2E82_32412 [Cichorium intybus]|uniref:Uncharacterized protein n=1 Tax=Cichorium intybus TaxID=13427 RepID=A0ACB9BFX0_CICIN|nr:hypothetical protein L2E82_32412 [Cichorium intybus]